MIVLDTNVLSEALRPSPSTVVMSWLAAQETSEVFVSTITQAELLSGIEVLPAGRRRSLLETAIEKLFAEQFEGRLLPFDEPAARAFAKIVRSRERLGRPISQADAMIAAIARAQRAAVATRNTSDFEHSGIRIINPWTA